MKRLVTKKIDQQKNLSPRAAPARRRRAIAPATGGARAIVAIGASAGGLEPIEKFFDFIPRNTGVAFVIIQHLDPNFKSLMNELLMRHSEIPIHKVEEGMTVDADAIYLNPARSDLQIKDGRFALLPSTPTKGLNLPINFFFESAAREFGERAIGIILSGTGSDGTRGCEAIKAAGGTIFVQDPDSAKFDSMPVSVIAKDLADAIATPERLAALVTLQLAGKLPKKARPYHDRGDDGLTTIFSIIKKRHGIDFSVYKLATMERRIRRRMGLLKFRGLMDYADILAVDNHEVTALVKDLLVDVTEFFRDPESYAALEKKVVAPLVDAVMPEREVRVWIAGCSSGEEAYSIAITFAECARHMNRALSIKILATDISSTSLTVASAGLYADASLKKAPADIVQRYFEKEEHGYRISKSIRKLIVFSQHDLLKDPPFTKIDLVSCRNVLIYFNEGAQKHAIAMFHFALAKGATLFLGPSESITAFAPEFKPISQKWRIFQKLRDTRLFDPNAMMKQTESIPTRVESFRAPSRLAGPNQAANREPRKATFGAMNALLERYAPPGFLLTRDGLVVHIFGSAAKLATLSPGAFSQNIIEILPKRLSAVVLQALSASNREGFDKFRRALRHGAKSAEFVDVVSLEALPADDQEQQFLLLTIDRRVNKTGVSAAEVDSAEQMSNQEAAHLQKRVEDLTFDLQSSEENLQATVEELATSNEELQSANEELMASNEELQSTNEELHSVNEELYTVSAEHQRKIDELTQVTSDLEHLLEATEIGTIFLDNENYIRWFTPAAAAAFNLLPHDMGRPIDHITARFSGSAFRELLEEVHAARSMREREIIVNGRTYLLRLLPYKIDGIERSEVVIVIIDIDELKRTRLELSQLSEIHEQVLASVHEAIVSWDAATGKIQFCNEAYANYLGLPKSEILGVKLQNLLPDAQCRALESAISTLKPGETASETYRIEAPDGTVRWREKHVRCICDAEGKITDYVASGAEISEVARYAKELTALAELSSSSAIPTESMARDVMAIGLDLLGLEQGLLACAVEGDFNVSCRSKADVADVAGEEVRPAEAFLCSRVFGQKEVINFSEISHFDGQSELVGKAPEIGSFVGAPVVVGDKPYGVLCLYSKTRPRYGRFTELQLGFVNLMSRWISWKIGNERHVAENVLIADHLRRVNAELANANDGLNKFAHVASHDLQEPLRKISQFGDLLLNEYGDVLDEDGKKYIHIMRDASLRMRRLTRDILAYSKSANASLQYEALDLGEMMRRLVVELEIAIADAGAKIEMFDLPAVRGDAIAIGQLFTNLLTNSLKYRRDDAELAISVRAEIGGAKTVRIYVKDNGCGFEQRFAEVIFNPFTRLHTASQIDGSGLGLAICKSVCDRHGWKISVESVLGEGSEFAIEIPASDIIGGVARGSA